jgi:hypothetical protein
MISEWQIRMGIGETVWINDRCSTGIFLQRQGKNLWKTSVTIDVWAKIWTRDTEIVHQLLTTSSAGAYSGTERDNVKYNNTFCNKQLTITF